MVVSIRAIVLVLTVTSVFLDLFQTAPVRSRYLTMAELEEIVVKHLDEYYEEHMRNRELKDSEENSRKKADIYDTMQGDQPVVDENNVESQQKPLNFPANISDNLLQASRNRTKDNWIKLLKMNILQQIGRANSSGGLGFNKSLPFNLTQFFPTNPNETNQLEEFISKKIRTFYPSCTAPEPVIQEFKAEEKMMSLYFNYTQDDQTNEIAEATLRLHAIIQKNSTNSGRTNCTQKPEEEEKLYRISAYFYVKNLKNKRRPKKRLCDSKVIKDSSKYVELNMAAAVSAWNDDQNLGLAIQVEDQDAKTMKTEKFFMGPSCSVGVSISKSSTNIILDSEGTSEQFFRLLGRNSTSPSTSDILLLPTLEVCTMESSVSSNGTKFSTRNCKRGQQEDQAQNVLEKDKLERLATLATELRPSTSTTHRRLRHQRNYLEESLAQSETKLLMTREQVLEIVQNLNLSNSTDLNVF